MAEMRQGVGPVHPRLHGVSGGAGRIEGKPEQHPQGPPQPAARVPRDETGGNRTQCQHAPVDVPAEVRHDLPGGGGREAEPTQNAIAGSGIDRKLDHEAVAGARQGLEPRARAQHLDLRFHLGAEPGDLGAKPA